MGGIISTKKKEDKLPIVDISNKSYKEIINGLSAPLQWTAKNGSNIPVRIIEKIEKLVKRNLN